MQARGVNLIVFRYTGHVTIIGLRLKTRHSMSPARLRFAHTPEHRAARHGYRVDRCLVRESRLTCVVLVN